MSSYKILSAHNLEELEEVVNEEIENKWKPQGGVSVVSVEGSYFAFAQAMVKIRAITATLNTTIENNK